MTPAEHTEHARTSAKRAIDQASSGRFDEAIVLFNASIKHYQIAVDHGCAENRRCISTCRFLRGETFEHLGRLEEAAQDYKDGARVCEQLLQEAAEQDYDVEDSEAELLRLNHSDQRLVGRLIECLKCLTRVQAQQNCQLEKHTAEQRRPTVASIARSFDPIVERLQKELCALRSRSYLCLILGVFFALTCVVLLLACFLGLVPLEEARHETTRYVGLASRILGRYSLILFMASISFYFLRHFTALSSRICVMQSDFLALQASVLYGNPRDVSEVILRITSNGRNRIFNA